MRVEFKDFLRNLENFNTHLYFITGPEEYPKLRARDRLLATPRFKDLTRSILPAHEVKAPDLLEKFSQLQLFGKGEVVVLQGAERLGAPAKKALLEILESEEDVAGRPVLICLADNLRTDAADPLEGYAMANKRAVHVFFPVLTESEVMAWARGETKRKGLEIPAEAYERIAEVYSSDLYAWANLIRNLELYLAPAKKAEMKDLENLIAFGSPQEQAAWNSLENSLLDLAEGPGGGKSLESTLSSIQNFFASASESADTYAMRIFQLAGERVYEIASVKAGVNPSRSFPYKPHRDRIRKAAQRWEWEKIIRAYQVILEGERKIKKGILPPQDSILNSASKLWELSN